MCKKIVVIRRMTATCAIFEPRRCQILRRLDFGSAVLCHLDEAKLRTKAMVHRIQEKNLHQMQDATEIRQNGGLYVANSSYHFTCVGDRVQNG